MWYAIDNDDVETYLGVEQPIVYGFDDRHDRDLFVDEDPETREIVTYKEARKYLIWYDEDGGGERVLMRDVIQGVLGVLLLLSPLILAGTLELAL